jgi:muramidase (phage lysozyme)
MATILTTNGNVASTGSIFISSTGSTSLSVNQNSLLYLSSSNRVGVNNTNPSYTLDVNGDINSTGNYRSSGITVINNAANIYAASISSSNLSSSGVLFYNSTGTQISNNSSSFYWDNTNFRLGIGTSSLNAILHINATNGNISPLLLEKTAGSTVFSVTPYSGKVYLGAGIYQNGAGNFVTQNGTSTAYQLIALNPGIGVTWAAPQAGVLNTSPVTLWNDSGSWVSNINNTSITSSTISASAFSGSHFGTSSWSSNSLSSSYGLSSSYSLSGSYALSASYAPSTGTGTPGGANTQIQYNNSSTFGGSSTFTFNNSSNLVLLSGSLTVSSSGVSNTVQVIGNISASSFTGSHFGTSSWAQSASVAISASYSPAAAASLTGGVANYIPLWTSTSALSTSSISQTSTSVTIVGISSSTILPTGSSGLLISQSLSQSAVTSSQIYSVNISPLFTNSAPFQIQTALKVNPIFTGSFTGSNTRNLIADFSTPSAGTQFSVNDIISGSIYQVNDVSGLPIIEALSDWTVKIWNYPNVVLYKSSSNIAINNTTFNSTTPESLLVSGSTFNIISGYGNINNYIQLNIKNSGSGATGSSDIVATNDTGNEVGNYVDLGINSSGHVPQGDVGQANDGYLYNTGSNFYIGNVTSGKNLYFFAGSPTNTSSVTLTSTGNFGVGTANPLGTLDVIAQSNSLSQSILVVPPQNSNSVSIYVSGSNTKGGSSYIDFLKVTNTSASAATPNKYFRLDGTGTVQILSSDYSTAILTLTNAGVLNTTGGGTSDIRVKNNIEYIYDNTSPTINQLKPAKFEFNNNLGVVRHGFIAQDVLQIKPDLVLGDGNKENGTYGLDYEGILALTVKSLQEANAKIIDLENRISQLENK